MYIKFVEAVNKINDGTNFDFTSAVKCIHSTNSWKLFFLLRFLSHHIRETLQLLCDELFFEKICVVEL
jgi:hypothetical protein